MALGTLKLSDYDISPQFGFLPCDVIGIPPLGLYYKPWQDISENLPNLLASNRLRAEVDGLPILSCKDLRSIPEQRRAYSILAFISQAYIWAENLPAKRIPPSVSIPFLSICKSLNLPPVATYAAVVLWNFRTTIWEQRPDRLDNLATLTTFTGAIDESWFYLISVAIEAKGGPLIASAVEATNLSRAGRTDLVAIQLDKLAAGIVDLKTVLQRIYENCDPHFFSNKLRRFLAGSKNMAKFGLPDGVIFDEGTGNVRTVKLSGGSNAQSSLFQFFDVALGVTHRVGECGGAHQKNKISNRDTVASPGNLEDGCRHVKTVNDQNYLSEIRQYMPERHRQFLDDFAAVANIRQFVENNLQNEALVLAYDACISALVQFRNTHMAIVSQYVIAPAQVKAVHQHQSDPTTIHLYGTGGTALIPFLRLVRNETRESAINGNCTAR